MFCTNHVTCSSVIALGLSIVFPAVLVVVKLPPLPFAPHSEKANFRESGKGKEREENTFLHQLYLHLHFTTFRLYFGYPHSRCHCILR